LASDYLLEGVMNGVLVSILVAAVAFPSIAAAQVTSVPGFYARIFSDVEGYAFGSRRPLDPDAPRGFSPVFAGTLVAGDGADGLGLSAGYGASAGTNPWRVDLFYERVEPDGGDGANGVGLSGAYQIAAEEGLWAITASGGIETVEDAFDLIRIAANGEMAVPRTDLSFGASLGFSSVDFDGGGSESDVTAALEGIYSFPDAGVAVSVSYTSESDVTEDGFGVSATWAVPESIGLPRNSNIRAGVAEDAVFLRYRVRM
jgi:hypothetical protein